MIGAPILLLLLNLLQIIHGSHATPISHLAERHLDLRAARVSKNLLYSGGGAHCVLVHKRIRGHPNTDNERTEGLRFALISECERIDGPPANITGVKALVDLFGDGIPVVSEWLRDYRWASLWVDIRPVRPGLVEKRWAGARAKVLGGVSIVIGRTRFWVHCDALNDEMRVVQVSECFGVIMSD